MTSIKVSLDIWKTEDFRTPLGNRNAEASHAESRNAWGASVFLSKHQTNPSENSFLAPKYKLVAKTALLRQFAKCALLPYLLILFYNGRKYVRMESSRIRTRKCRVHSHTFRFDASGNKPGVNDSKIVFQKCKTSVSSSE